VLRDAKIFVDRVKTVGGQLNEDTSDLEALLRTSGDWCGVHLEKKNVDRKRNAFLF
jgi:hypothetical protein